MVILVRNSYNNSLHLSFSTIDSEINHSLFAYIFLKVMEKFDKCELYMEIGTYSLYFVSLDSRLLYF